MARRTCRLSVCLPTQAQRSFRSECCHAVMFVCLQNAIHHGIWQIGPFDGVYPFEFLRAGSDRSRTGSGHALNWVCIFLTYTAQKHQKLCKALLLPTLRYIAYFDIGFVFLSLKLPLSFIFTYHISTYAHVASTKIGFVFSKHTRA